MSFSAKHNVRRVFGMSSKLEEMGVSPAADTDDGFVSPAAAAAAVTFFTEASSSGGAAGVSALFSDAMGQTLVFMAALLLIVHERRGYLFLDKTSVESSPHLQAAPRVGVMCHASSFDDSVFRSSSTYDV